MPCRSPYFAAGINPPAERRGGARRHVDEIYDRALTLEDNAPKEARIGL